MNAIGLTDHGNMYGAIEFYKLCKKHEVKPILGVEAYIANRTRFDKQAGVDNKRYHLTLLSRNMDGYKNLIQLVTKSNLEGYYYKPRMDKDILREHHEGLICGSGCLGGELCQALWERDYEKAERIALEYRDIFGAENYFIEVMSHPNLERFNEITEQLLKLAKKLNIPLIATQDCHYLKKEDGRAEDTLVAINTNEDMSSRERLTLSSDDFSFIDMKTAEERFRDMPGAIENTMRIAERCSLDLPLGKWYFPDFKIPEGTTHEQILRTLTYEGLAKRKVDATDEVKTRIEYELGVICQKGYAPYFLVVSDLLIHAKEEGIRTNTRGSAAGSLVSYLVGITNVNPLRYRLPFERFLNPERPSAPDIDMDYADNRRDEMLVYAKKKYGEAHVAQIGTFGTMAARGSVRDVTRALGHPYVVGDRLSKMIPMGSQGFPMTIEHALEMNPELKQAYDGEPTTKEIIDLARKIEGCARHVSVHAAGVVISPTPLTDFVPLQFDPNGGKIITQYDMYTVEEAGLLKFDFLGIRNLSIMGDAVRLIKERHDVDIDLDHLPEDDKKTFDLLARGETMGLFQLGSSGMTKYLMELRPTTIDDINAMVALYRPGPLAFIPDYIARKRNPRLVKYLDPRLEAILAPTFGIIIYQDDILLIAVQLAGYSWGEADKFRKAVGKKIPEEMAAQKEKFSKGCVAHGMAQKAVEDLWQMIETFAAYGFNKAHAASYGWFAYQTSFLKANYPVDYMCAVLTAEAGDVEEISKVIEECKRMKIPVLPPDVNKSYGDFTVVREKKGDINQEIDEIRFGLYTIKNLGTDISNAIIAERERGGAYKSFTDFLDRVQHKNLNKKSLEALIKAGAMDAFTERGVMLNNMEAALEYNRDKANVAAGQDSLFGLMDDKTSVPLLTLKPSDPIPLIEKLAWEKELLGLYVSGHPLDLYRDKFEKSGITIAKILEEGVPKPIVVAGLIDEVREIFTKKNDKMAFVKMSDYSGTIEMVFFPKTFESAKDLIVPGKCVAVRGNLTKRNDELSLIAEAVKELGS